jgi:hypothetical protein
MISMIVNVLSMLAASWTNLAETVDEQDFA